LSKRKEKEIIETVKELTDIIVVQAKRPLTEAEHEMISNKLKLEQEATGIKIVLIPYSVELEKDSEDDSKVPEEILAELEELRKFKQDADEELEELRKFKLDIEEKKQTSTGDGTKEGE
jgi:hypothetical protein